MKKILVLSLCLVLAGFTASAQKKSPQEIYIEQFAPLAVEEMYRSGVPASITLAQGLLESRYGLSDLAVKGNNHFGIKCHNTWTGGKMYHDDDRKGECFRKYGSPEQSYRDHSDFLRYRDRYRFLFDYKVTDYKSWAYGLSKAGYATDPAYPSKLIKLIEEYRLHEYDLKPVHFKGIELVSVGTTERTLTKEERKAVRKAAKEARQVKESLTGELPQSPSQIEQVKTFHQEKKNAFHFKVSREVYSRNGVAFVYAEEGDTYESIAAAYDLFQKEILRFNDLKAARPLEPGMAVYIQAKKQQSAKGLDKHVIEGGESMWDIAQRYGVKLDRLYKMNGMTGINVPIEGDIIKLRK